MKRFTSRQIECMQLTTVAHVLAYRDAREKIETLTHRIRMDGVWHDLNRLVAPYCQESVHLAERYLQLSGQLERHPHPDHEYHLVRVLESKIVSRKSKMGRNTP